MPAASSRASTSLRLLMRIWKRLGESACPSPPRPTAHGVGHRGDDLGVDGDGRGARRVNVELRELAKPSRAGLVGAEDRAEVVAAEREFQVLGVLGDEPRERDGQVEPHRDRLFLGALQAEQRLVRLLAAGADEGGQVLEDRRVDREEAVALVDGLDLPDHVVAQDHVLRQQVLEPFEGLRLDQFFFCGGGFGRGGHGWNSSPRWRGAGKLREVASCYGRGGNENESVPGMGLEPMTFATTARRSSQLSYPGERRKHEIPRDLRNLRSYFYSPPAVMSTRRPARRCRVAASGATTSLVEKAAEWNRRDRRER